MKIQLIRQSQGKYQIVKSSNASNDVIIQRNRVKILDENKEVESIFLLEGLGQLSWLPIETTGNHEIFAQILVGPEIPKKSFGEEDLG